MARMLNLKILGLNGIEFAEEVDDDWKPEPPIAALEEGLLDFVKVLPRISPPRFNGIVTQGFTSLSEPSRVMPLLFLLPAQQRA